MQAETFKTLEPHLRGKIQTSKLSNFINTMAVLFNITLPCLTAFQIVNEWRKLGLLPLHLDNTLLKCPTIITDEMRERIRAAMPRWTDIFCEKSRIDDKYLTPVMGENMHADLSAKGLLRSDGPVLKTCTAAHERVRGNYLNTHNQH